MIPSEYKHFSCPPPTPDANVLLPKESSVSSNGCSTCRKPKRFLRQRPHLCITRKLENGKMGSHVCAIWYLSAPGCMSVLICSVPTLYIHDMNNAVYDNPTAHREQHLQASLRKTNHLHGLLSADHLRCSPDKTTLEECTVLHFTYCWTNRGHWLAASSPW